MAAALLRYRYMADRNVGPTHVGPQAGREAGIIYYFFRENISALRARTDVIIHIDIANFICYSFGSRIIMVPETVYT